MHILFILENYYPAIGGVETLFKSLVDELDERGVKTTILTTRLHDLPKIEKLGNSTIVRYRYWSRYLFTFLAFFPALKYGRHVDIIHTTSYNAGLPASLAGFFLKKRVLITFHEVWGKLWFKLPFFGSIAKMGHYLFEQMLLRMPFHKFIAVSEFTANRLLKNHIPDDKIRVIYNGIKPDQWRCRVEPSENQPYTFVYYGRLGISKGLDLLLPAYRLLVENINSTKLILVLPKSPAGQLQFVKKEIEAFSADLKPEVLHELSHAELNETICKADCVVIPSYSEGFGYTAVESMSMGKPIISSGRGALKEVVGGNFIEMKSHDIIGLKNAMQDAIDQKWNYTEPTNFHLEDTVDEYMKLYQDLLQLKTGDNDR